MQRASRFHRATRDRGPLWLALAALVGIGLAGCDALQGVGPLRSGWTPSFDDIIPRPLVAFRADDERHFEISGATAIHTADSRFLPAADLLAGTLRPATGFALPVNRTDPVPAAGIRFVAAGNLDLGPEGYALRVTPDAVTIEAASPEAAIWGAQTLRQLLPPRVERDERQSGPWRIPTGTVIDSPRYAWRGAMLDVARHFFTPAEVERFIDVLSYYKLNRLHLHLTDDQGWRLMIRSWPNLARHGGSLEVGGTRGGYYSQLEYVRLVRYAAARGVVIVPEIEMPGHNHAALASYPELGCMDEAPELYTGIAVGFSTFCFTTDFIYGFLADVLGELAAMTPGEYVHIGADETYVLPKHHYLRFVPKIEQMLADRGKRLVGWEEIGTAEIGPRSIVQFWDRPDRLQLAVDRGVEIIMSPARYAYFDSKYNPRTPIGRTWTSEFLDVRKAYSWDPEELAPAAARILGVEGSLFTETVHEYSEVEYLAFPRLLGLAEIGWTRQPRNWEEYRVRLGRHGARLDAMNVNYYRSPEVDWTD